METGAEGEMMNWQMRQLEKLSETEPERIHRALEKLLNSDADLQEQIVTGAYLDGDINLGKAAELLHVDAVELRRRFLDRGIPIRVGLNTVDDLQAEVKAAERLYTSE